MDKPPSHESSELLLTDFLLFPPQHGNLSLLEDDHIFIDIFATVHHRNHGGQSLQPTVKISRLGPLVKEQDDEGISWKSNTSVEIPLDVQHINITVSFGKSKDAVQKLGYIDQDSESIWDIALDKETCVPNLVDDFGSTSDYVLNYSFVVIPKNEFVSFKRHAGNTKHAVMDEREMQIDAWLGHENDKTTRFAKLACFFYERFERIGDTCDIETAIAYESEIVRLTPDGDRDKALRLSNLGNSLSTRFERYGSLKDLNISIIILEDMVWLTPDGHPYKPLLLNNIGNLLARRFERLGDLDDINKSIIMSEDAVRLTPDGHPDKPLMFNNLANSLARRFERLGSLSDLNISIIRLEDVVRLTPDGHPDKPSRLNSLGSLLLTQFKHLGSLKDLNISIITLEDVVRLTPDGHPDKPSRLNSLGNSLLTRFKHLGSLDDIDKSIIILEEAVRLTPDGHPDKPLMFNNLGNSLARRFERLGSLDDIDKSIIMSEDAVRLTPDGHPDKPSRLNNLGNSLFLRFGRLGDLDDINKSVAISEVAVCLTPDGHPDKPSRLNSLGNSLLTRFKHLASLNNLNNSIIRKDGAVRLTPDDHPHKSLMLNNLGNSLARRFERLGSLNDLNISIIILEEAVRLTPNSHPDKPSLFSNLGNSLLTRLETLGDCNDKIRSMHCYSSAASPLTGAPIVKFQASSLWAGLAAQLEDPSLLAAYRTALSLLPQIAWIGSPVIDRQFYLREAGPVVRRAAVAAIESDDPATAVEWLEQGRSVIWGQILHLRQPITQLRSSYPELASTLLSLSSILEGAQATGPRQLPSTGSSKLKNPPDYHSVAHKREQLIAHIRQLPGFERFLLPKPLSELAEAAQHGPVVMLNAGEKQCDALVLVPGLRDNIVYIPLPNISAAVVITLHNVLQDLVKHVIPTNVVLSNTSTSLCNMERLNLIFTSQDRSRKLHQEQVEGIFKAVLHDLWDWVVKPVVEGLALTIHEPCRIWWCPTGPFSFLPLHAAGDYSRDAPTGSKLMDYAISSYTPSLTSLIHARDSMPTIPEAARFLAVIPSSDLPGTQQELKFIENHAKKNDVPLTWLVNSDATVSEVKKQMSAANVVHFACHGVQDSKTPTQSSLSLSRGSRLTLSEIIGMKMPSKDLAFLSACQTATGDETLSDEAVHLAAGMLSAGYRGVLATLWNINDSYAPQVANDVYAHLFKDGKFDSTKAAEALHFAVKKLQATPGVSFRIWVPFIHLGL